jgi:DNA-directed RNA polymerase specialized sigma24 family protein
MADVPVGDTGSIVVDRDQVERALRRLDPDWRAVVVVHYFLGLPLPETAAALGIPLGTVKSRLHRSLAAMRVELETESGSEAVELPRGQIA